MALGNESKAKLRLSGPLVSIHGGRSILAVPRNSKRRARCAGGRRSLSGARRTLLRRGVGRGAAFSLIEILVSILIVAVLILLGSAALRATREAARNSVSLSNLRSHCQIFAVYNSDYKGMQPYFTEIGSLTYHLNGGGLSLPVSFFDASRTWHIALADQYYNGDARSESLFSPQYARDGGAWPLYGSYEYGCVFITAPSFWTPETRTGPDQWTATSNSSVLFPSNKVLLVQTWPHHSLDRSFGSGNSSSVAPLLAGTCDGGARRVSWRDRLNGYERGDGYIFNTQGAVHFSDNPPLLHTLDGIHGRDLQ